MTATAQLVIATIIIGVNLVLHVRSDTIVEAITHSIEETCRE